MFILKYSNKMKKFILMLLMAGVSSYYSNVFSQSESTPSKSQTTQQKKDVKPTNDATSSAIQTQKVTTVNSGSEKPKNYDEVLKKLEAAKKADAERKAKGIKEDPKTNPVNSPFKRDPKGSGTAKTGGTNAISKKAEYPKPDLKALGITEEDYQSALKDPASAKQRLEHGKVKLEQAYKSGRISKGLYEEKMGKVRLYEQELDKIEKFNLGQSNPVNTKTPAATKTKKTSTNPPGTKKVLDFNKKKK
jgi:hypothetical protein